MTKREITMEQLRSNIDLYGPLQDAVVENFGFTALDQEEVARWVEREGYNRDVSEEVAREMCFGARKRRMH